MAGDDMGAALPVPAPVAPIEVLGVPVHPLTVAQLHGYIDARVAGGEKALVLHANVHGLNLAHEQPELKAILRGADLVFCDGAGVMLAARLLGEYIPERISYADWLPKLTAHCAQRGHSMFLLGSKPTVAEEAARTLRARFPGLRVVGTHDGYFDHTKGSTDSEAVVRQISETRPDVLLVGLGMPLQEHWLAAHWDRIDARIGLSCGAALDYASGNLKRGPALLTDHGFEWLARLAIEPRRLFRRYAVGNPLFMARLVRDRIGL